MRSFNNSKARSHVTQEHIDYALQQLTSGGLSTNDAAGDANRYAVIWGFSNPYDIAMSLRTLNTIGLLSGEKAQANRDAVAKHSHPNALQNFLDSSIEAGWLTTDNVQSVFDKIVTYFNSVPLNHALQDLKNHLFTVKKFESLINIAMNFPSIIAKRSTEITLQHIEQLESKEEVIKNARLLAQGKRDTSTFFANLPDEILVNIAAKTRSLSVHNEKEAEKLAERNLNKPVSLKKK